MQPNPSLKENTQKEKPSLDQVLQELLDEANMLDDHGPVILGGREDPPTFHSKEEKSN